MCHGMGQLEKRELERRAESEMRVREVKGKRASEMRANLYVRVSVGLSEYRLFVPGGHCVVWRASHSQCEPQPV
jgi:hypothetical protein